MVCCACLAAHRGHVRSEETRGGGDVSGAGGRGGQTEGPAAAAVGAVSQAALRDVEALVEQLSGVCLHARHSRGPVAEEEEEEEEQEGRSTSLMQHIQVEAGFRRPVGYGLCIIYGGRHFMTH